MPSIKSSIGNSKYISLDNVCDLIAEEIVEGKLNQKKTIEKEPRTVFCSTLNINRHEFFSAGQANMKPQIMLVVNADEYDGETLVKYDNNRYRIYRTYTRSDGHIELYCEVKIGG